MEVVVIRSNRKTMSLTTDAEGRAVVRAPLRTKEAQIAEFVKKHEDWLQKRIAASRLDLADGAELSLCGTAYTLRTGVRARIAGKEIVLPERERERALAALMKKMARERMRALLDAVCEKTGLSYTKLSVNSARGKWGSCSSKKSINFSFRTAFLPDPLAEYLAVHELCHTIYMNHGKEFWGAVERLMPDYRARRKALKGYQWASAVL